jgi:hypothetical protein
MYGLRSAPSRRLHRQATAQNLTVPTLMLQHEMKESLDKRHGKTMEYDQQGSPPQAGLSGYHLICASEATRLI